VPKAPIFALSSAIEHQHVVLAAHRLDLFEIGPGRHDNAARALHRLGEERGDGVGAFRLNQRIELIRESRREQLLALTRLRVAVGVRARRLEHAGNRHVEAALVDRKVRQARRGHGDAVVGAVAGDDLFLFRAAERVVVVPDNLDSGVDRFRAGAGEEHAAHRRGRDAQELLGELDRRRVRLGAEQVIERQFLDLALGRFGEAALAEAERRAPQARHRLDVTLALGVGDPHALAGDDRQRAVGLVLAEIGVGMQHAGLVGFRQGGGVPGLIVSAVRRRLLWSGHCGHR